MPETTDVRAEIAAFESAAAALFAGFAKEDQLDKSGFQSNLSAVGISADVTVTGEDVKIKVKVPEAPGCPASVQAGDLTSDALNRYAGEYLRTRKDAVWNAIKRMEGNGTLTGERAISVLRDLGYGDTSLPAVKTTVTGEMARKRNDGYDSFSFILPGEHDKDAVAAKLAEVAQASPVNQLITQAFAEAEFGRDNQPVRNLRVRADLTWPSRSEYAAS